MILKTKKINESLTLNFVTTDKFKTGMLALSVSMPRENHTPTYNYLLSGLMRRGTKSYPSMAMLNRRLDELFAATVEIKSVRHARRESFLILAELLDNAFSDDGTDIVDGVLGVMSELLLSPKLDDGSLFPADTLAKEKKIAADSMRAIINNPKSYATLRAGEIMNRDDKDALLLQDTIKMTEEISREAISEHYKKNFTTRPIDVFYVGSLTEDEITEKILRHFGDHKATLFENCTELSVRLTPRECVSVTESMPVSQGKLVMGMRTGITAATPDYYAMILFSEIYGGSPISKLFMNVREKMSLCYYCSSSYNMYNGTLTISSGIEVSDFEKAKEAILAELDAIKKGEISDTELVAAKRSLINSYRQIYDNPFDMHAFSSARRAFGIDADIETCCERINSLTLADVVRVAKGVEPDTIYFLCGEREDGGEEDYE